GTDLGHVGTERLDALFAEIGALRREVGNLEVAVARQWHGEPAVAHPRGERAFAFVVVARKAEPPHVEWAVVHLGLQARLAPGERPAAVGGNDQVGAELALGALGRLVADPDNSAAPTAF